MKVLNYQAHNILRLSDISLDLEGRHLFLVGGRNNQGKSSTLTALLMALCGRSGFDYPEIALREGETEGWVKVRLKVDGEEEKDDLQEDNYLDVELLLKQKRNKQVVEAFRVLDSAGEEAPTPRDLLKRLYNLRAFDPLHFEQLDKKAKTELLKKMLGLDFSAETKEYDSIYAKRADVNRYGVKCKGVFESMKYHADAPAELVDTGKLMDDLSQIEKANQAAKEAAQAAQAAQNRVDSFKAEIEKLEKALASAKISLQQELTNLDAKQKALVVPAFTDPAPIKEQIRTADTVNQKVRENKQYQIAKEELDELRAQSEGYTKALEAILAEKDRKLREAKWPVEGLSMDESGVLLNGLPIEQASKSQRIKASVKIGMALNPKLRLLVCQAGSDLDLDTLSEIEEILKENDFQMLVETVTRTSADEELCAVVIEDGKRKAVAV